MSFATALRRGAPAVTAAAIFCAGASPLWSQSPAPPSGDAGETSQPVATEEKKGEAVPSETTAAGPPAFADPCGTIEAAAHEHGLPLEFFTRLLWQESRFKPGAVSPKGAQGIAQFMPGTAADRGLADPFNPDEAIWASAHLLHDLRADFGNLGLAAAAYNGGPTRVANWLAGTGTLPIETQDYVRIITGYGPDSWSEGDRASRDTALLGEPRPSTCPEIKLALAKRAQPEGAETARPTSPWGVQLAGSFSRNAALRVFANLKLRYGSILASYEPMVVVRRDNSRGSRAFHHVRVGSPSRQSANLLCDRLRAAGGACAVMRN